MSEIKHTPGPWTAKWSKYRDDEFIVQTEHPSKRVIACFDDDGDGAGEQSIADAHLIAAAPDMLSALKAAFYNIVGLIVADAVERNGWEWTDDAGDYVHPAAEQVRTAILKAEGR